MKLYCVNLKRSRDRRSTMTREFGKLPFEFSFIDAVDGRLLSERDLNLVYDKWRTRFRLGRSLERGEIGCVLSHVEFYRTLLNSQDTVAAVFEDDVTFLPDCLEALKTIESFLKKKKGPCLVELPGSSRDLPHDIIGEDQKMVQVSDSMGTYAYALNRAAAELLLKAFTPVRMPIDSYRYLIRKLGLRYYVFPRIVLTVNMEVESTIGRKRFFHARSAFHRFVYKIWRVIGVSLDHVLSMGK